MKVLRGALRRVNKLSAPPSEHSSAILACVRDAIFFIDYDTQHVVDCNRAACEMYGYTREEIVGMKANDLRPPEHREVLHQFFDDAVSGNAYAESVGLRKDGTTFPTEVTGRAAFIDGRMMIVGSVRDATERRHDRERLVHALHAAIRASRLKSEFVATISHEIRTPMNGVIGMTDLLLHTDLTEEQRGYVETVRESAAALLHIIEDILDFSKLEAGKMELDITAFDVRRTVESVAAILGPNASEKGIGLMTFIDPRLPSLVRGDSGRLRQILLNLAGNAVKFTSSGRVTVSVEPDANGKVRFSVLDTGIGMSKGVIDKLFAPFTQGDSSTTRRFGGTGLGLSISRRLVELMGGVLEVASTEGVGSRFWFSVALPTVSEGDAAVHLRGKRCAVVVQDERTRLMLSLYAKSWKMQNVSAASMQDRALTEPFDIAIVDENAVELIERFPETRFITIVTSEASPALKRGIASILRAPLTQSAVYRALDKALATKRRSEPAIETDVPLNARVLLAEDNAVNQRVLRKQLERLGCDVVIVTNGKEAVKRAAETFDVILMDCHMPEMDGFASARAIRDAERLSGAHTPIVALTAAATEQDRMACLDAGMDDYLAKPAELGALRSAIARWMVEETSV